LGKYCQAQLHVKLRMKAELALMSQHFPVNVDLIHLQEYSRIQILRQPQFLAKWKTTSTFWKTGDNLNFKVIEDELNFNVNGRQPQL
jgi:hypothetical protein